jgi:hypothetical protein
MMRTPNTVRGFAAVFCVAVLSISAPAQALTFTGQIVTTASQPRRFNVKLYPPKTTGKPILVATSDAYGRFKFSGLSPMSYLLEIYLGTVLAYQEVINMTKNTDRKIDLRKK